MIRALALCLCLSGCAVADWALSPAVGVMGPPVYLPDHPYWAYPVYGCCLNPYLYGYYSAPYGY